MFIFINIISYIINNDSNCCGCYFYIILTSNDFFCDAPKYFLQKFQKLNSTFLLAKNLK